MLAWTDAGNWYAHGDGLEPNEETMDAQETGLNSGKMLDREIHAQKDGLGVNENDIEEVRERRLKSSKMLVGEIDDAQEDGSKSSKMLIGDTVGQEDGLKYNKRLVGDIEAQERGLEPNGEYRETQERGLEPNGECRETQEKRFNASRMLDGETDFQEMELRTSKMLKGDIGAHEEGFTRLGREARIEEICTERLRGATTRIHICGRIFFIQERREERGDPREDRIREIKTIMKLDLESSQSTGNFYCCQDTDTSGHKLRGIFILVTPVHSGPADGVTSLRLVRMTQQPVCRHPGTQGIRMELPGKGELEKMLLWSRVGQALGKGS